jgi:hypothetical protein
MSTPLSSLVAYATAWQLIQLYDARGVGDLIGDAGQRVPETVVAAGSNGNTLPQATLNVASTTGFPSSGNAPILTTLAGVLTVQTFIWTGLTATTFTGGSGGTGTLATGNPLSAILTDPVVAAALLGASGVVEQACLVGKRYQPSDLAILNGASQQSLVQLVCDLAFWRLNVRRHPKSEPTAVYKDNLETLKMLRLGERIWGIQEVAQAGATDIKAGSSGFMQDSDFQTLDLTTRVAGRMFGDRADEIRLNNW